VENILFTEIEVIEVFLEKDYTTIVVLLFLKINPLFKKFTW